MNLKELAAIAGVSVSTVSKAFSGAKDIGEAVRERIFAIAKENGCFEKYDKRPRSRPLIAILVPEPESEYYGQLAGELERGISARGGDAVYAVTRFAHDTEARLFSEFAYRFCVDGIILIGNGGEIKNPDKIPLIILTANNDQRSDAELFQVDSLVAIQKAVRSLKEAGHRKVAFLGERLTQVRKELFCEAMRAEGLSVLERYIVESEYRFEEGGYRAMQTLLDRGDPPTAVLAGYTYMALGAIRCARDRGLRVPEDISFVGMDRLSVSPYLDVPVSAIETDVGAVTEELVSLLFRKIENRHYRSRSKISIPSEFNPRKTVSKR